MINAFRLNKRTLGKIVASAAMFPLVACTTTGVSVKLGRSLVVTLIAASALLVAKPGMVSSAEIAWRYVTLLTSDRVLANSFTPESSKGFKLCTTPSWSVENSGKPDAAKGWSVRKIPFKELHVGVDRGLCDFAAIRWDQAQHHAEIKQYMFETGLEDIPALAK